MGAAVETEHAAILFADVKGYSVLVSRDEVGTYARLRRARALFRALVGDYGGRIVDEAGDGVLAAFPNAGKAVDFALAIQRDLANAAAWQGESWAVRIPDGHPCRPCLPRRRAPIRHDPDRRPAHPGGGTAGAGVHDGCCAD